MNYLKESILKLAEYIRYNLCLLMNWPYFGRYMAARQGDPRRHSYMYKLVKQKCQKNLNNQAISILEIGSWAGSSAITWAEAIKKYNNGMGTVTCVDPWISYFDLERNKASVYQDMDQASQHNQIYKLFLHNIKTSKNNHIINSIRGKSLDVLPSIKNKKYDIIYIDGSHSYQDVLTDIRGSINLIKNNGIICGDDLEFQIEEIDLNFAKENKDKDYVLDPKTKKFYHPGVTLAVDEIFKKVSSWEGFWAIKKSESHWEQIILD